jgi:hypothetical protein
MYKVIFKNKKEGSSDIFKFFVTEEKAKLFQEQLEKENFIFIKMENLNEKTDNTKN